MQMFAQRVRAHVTKFTRTSEYECTWKCNVGSVVHFGKSTSLTNISGHCKEFWLLIFMIDFLSGVARLDNMKNLF